MRLETSRGGIGFSLSSEASKITNLSASDKSNGVGLTFFLFGFLIFLDGDVSPNKLDQLTSSFEWCPRCMIYL